MNPVQAGMVRPPRDHRWSSYRANAEGKVDRLITPHEEYLRLGSDPTGRHYTYRALFKAPLEGALIDQIREATNGNYVLGSLRF
jgi:putative transposase